MKKDLKNRVCRDCGVNPVHVMPSQISVRCKGCMSKKNKLYNEKHRDHIRKRSLAYYHQNSRAINKKKYKFAKKIREFKDGDYAEWARLENQAKSIEEIQARIELRNLIYKKYNIFV